ncbi:unnamed protein product, partial [Mycena citricolor]
NTPLILFQIGRLSSQRNTLTVGGVLRRTGDNWTLQWSLRFLRTRAGSAAVPTHSQVEHRSVFSVARFDGDPRGRERTEQPGSRAIIWLESTSVSLATLPRKIPGTGRG